MPTYNEADNIEDITTSIMEMDIGVSMVIVDDNSPDGTGLIADRLAEKFPRVRVLHRAEKKGYGLACIQGFEEAFAMGADVIFQMDADFSHDPAYLPEFLSAIGSHDVVIGSRYVRGGAVKNWGILRRVISKGGSLYSRIFTGMKLKDFTSGYRCYRSEVLKSIDFSKIATKGYGFLVELAYICCKMGYDVYEIPIVFADRRVGQSKMTGGIVLEAALAVPRLRWKYRGIGVGSS
ncbi:MAG: polyprenol monophosphomannose synthase [Actinomycetota bacterium]|nr:polyprenol monophosphomannose synthase [Actinomycetota bacterium]